MTVRVAADIVERLIQREARCLDLQRWEEWLSLFTEDCEYWVPASPDQESPKTRVSLFYEDRTLMETRIRRLKHPAAHSLVRPLRTCRLVAGTTIEDISTSASIVATSSFHMLEQYGERQRLFAGTYTHHLRQDSETILIRAKTVKLTNCDMPMEVIETFI